MAVRVIIAGSISVGRSQGPAFGAIRSDVRRFRYFVDRIQRSIQSHLAALAVVQNLADRVEAGLRLFGREDHSESVITEKKTSAPAAKASAASRVSKYVSPTTHLPAAIVASYAFIVISGFVAGMSGSYVNQSSLPYDLLL